MNLSILGSGTCAVTNDRSCSSYFIRAGNSNLLLDIGFGTMRRMAQAGIDYRDIDVILCTHFHLDHIGDLAPFLMATRFTPGFERRKPLTIIGPKKLKTFLQRCRELYGDWLLPTTEYQLNIIELDSEQIQLENCLMSALPMNHTKYTNGYRIEYNGRKLAYSGDTGPCDEIVQLCRDADMALIECSFPDENPFEFHLTPQQAGEIAEKAAVKRCVLTHFYPLMDNINVKAACATRFSGEIFVAKDFDSYTV